MMLGLERVAVPGVWLVFVSRAARVLHVMVDGIGDGAETASHAGMARFGYEAV